MTQSLSPREMRTEPSALVSEPSFDELVELVMRLSGGLDYVVAQGHSTGLTLTHRQVDILWHIDQYVGSFVPDTNPIRLETDAEALAAGHYTVEPGRGAVPRPEKVPAGR